MLRTRPPPATSWLARTCFGAAAPVQRPTTGAAAGPVRAGPDVVRCRRPPSAVRRRPPTTPGTRRCRGSRPGPGRGPMPPSAVRRPPSAGGHRRRLAPGGAAGPVRAPVVVRCRRPPPATDGRPAAGDAWHDDAAGPVLCRPDVVRCRHPLPAARHRPAPRGGRSARPRSRWCHHHASAPHPRRRQPRSSRRRPGRFDLGTEGRRSTGRSPSGLGAVCTTSAG